MDLLLADRPSNAIEPSRRALRLLDPRTGTTRTVLERPRASGSDQAVSCQALTQSAEWLYVALSPFAHRGESEPTLLILGLRDFMPRNRYRLAGLSDVEALLFWEGTLYTASAGTGEVVAFRTEEDRLHDERSVWRPRVETETGAPPRLTALATHMNELFATAVETTAAGERRGLLFNITRDAVARRFERAPVDLADLGERLVILFGQPGAIGAMDEPARELDAVGQALHAGEAGLFAATTSDLGEPWLHQLEPADFAPQGRMRLPAETAALISVEGAGAWPDPPEPFWFDTFGERLPGAGSLEPSHR